MIKQYLVALITFLMIDGVWLMAVAKNFYSKYLGYLMTKSPNLMAAGVFYLVFILGLVKLVIEPGINGGDIKQTIINSALFGLCCYATYDLTNMATIKDWPMIVTVVDLIWGTILSASVTGISYFILTKWLG